jgi:phage terminase large subunit
LAERPFEIDIDPEVFNECYLPIILDQEEAQLPFIYEEGGRASGKSRAIAQRQVLKGLAEPMRFGLVRKVADTIRDSQYKEIMDVVDEWNLMEHFTFGKSPLSITNRAGSEWITKGLDKSEKIKSLASVDEIWGEELTEWTREDFQTVNFTVRGFRKNGKLKQRVFSWNRTAGNWTEEQFFYKNGMWKPSNLSYHYHSTFKDNRFLSQEDLALFEELRLSDPEGYKKIAEGLPVELRGLIFPQITEIDHIPDGVIDRCYGIDFGFNDPTVLVELGFNDRDLYIDESYYQVNKTPNDFIGDWIELRNEGSLKRELIMYADSEAPDKIAEMQRAGFNVLPANKEKNSVEYGILLVKGFNIFITRRSSNVRRDLQIYKWKLDKNGNPTDKPSHIGSHSPDAIRNGAKTHLEPIIEAAVLAMQKKQSPIMAGVQNYARFYHAKRKGILR